MKKLYFFLLILFCSIHHLSGQVKQVVVERAELPGSHFQYVNKQTHVPVNEMVWEEAETFVNGFAMVFAKGKWGFVDGNGNPVISPVYNSVRNFVNHLAAVQENSKWGFIDEKGNIIIPLAYDIIYDFKEQVTAGYKNNTWYLINRSGDILKTLDVDIFRGFNNGKAEITKQGRNGFMNVQGDIISLAPAKKAPLVKNGSVASRNASTQSGVCPANIGFEDGNFTNWNCFLGEVTAFGTDNVVTVSPSPPTPDRHEIYPAANPSVLDPYGLFPINPPDGSGYAVKLGNDINGAKAERITYEITVPANSADASITYRYAVVFQDPGHLVNEQPRFSAMLYDVAAGTYLPCASYEYISTSSLPGFNSSPVNDTIKYKSWASVFVNLSAYAGKTLLLEFTTADCTRGAHWGYAYVDVGDCNITANIDYQCNPLMATMTGPPGFEYYNWWNDTFDSLLGTGETTVLNPAPALNSQIFVEVIPFNGYGCSDTLGVTVTANYPVADAGPDKSICLGSSATLGSAAVPGNSYSWSPATYLANPNIANPTCHAANDITYTLTVTNNATGCTSQDLVNVTLNAMPVAAFNTGPDQCLDGNNFTFTNESSVSTGSLYYTWSFGDGDSSTQRDPVHTYANPGNYVVSLIAATGSGCRHDVRRNVRVNTHPIVTAGDAFSICRGDSRQLQSAGAQTYEWSPATGLSCTDCPNPVASPGVSSTYIVRGLNNNGCPGYDTIDITVFQPININVSPDVAICEKQSVDLLANGSAVTYSWSPAQGLSGTDIPDPVATPAVTTQYRVIGYDGHHCFTDTGYITVTVNPNPTIDAGPDLRLSTGTIHPLEPVTQNGPIVYWQWNPATDLSCSTCPHPSVTVKNDITYDVVIRNVYGCFATDSVKIKTFCEGSQVFIPNAFTPDGDGLNDILMVRSKGIQIVKSFRIFSRWGELIFEKKDFAPNSPTYGWDGTIKGVRGPAEVYVYTAEVVCDNMETFVFKGNTTILK